MIESEPEASATVVFSMSPIKNSKRYPLFAVALIGLFVVPVLILVVWQLSNEPNYEFRLSDLVNGSTRLRFRDCDLSSEPRLSPVQQVVGDGYLCDAMIVNGTYEHYIDVIARTSDGCQRLKDILAANQMETLESDVDQNFDLDTQCAHNIPDSAKIFIGQISLNAQKYSVKGRFHEATGWVCVLIRRQ